MTNVYVIYKSFEDWIEPIPVAAYMTIVRAHQEADKLNQQRSDADLEGGMFYFVKDAGVPVYE